MKVKKMEMDVAFVDYKF